MFDNDTYLDNCDDETNEEWRYWEPERPDPLSMIQDLLFPILRTCLKQGDFIASIRRRTDNYGIFTYVTLEVNGERLHAWSFAEEESVQECTEWPFDHAEELAL